MAQRTRNYNWYHSARRVDCYLSFFTAFQSRRVGSHGVRRGEIAVVSENKIQFPSGILFRCFVTNGRLSNLLRFPLPIDKNVILHFIKTSSGQWQRHMQMPAIMPTHTQTRTSYTGISNFKFNKFCLFAPNINICGMFSFQLKSLFDWMFRWPCVSALLVCAKYVDTGTWMKLNYSTP